MEKKKPGTVTVPKENVKELLGKAKDGIVKAMDQNGDGTFDMKDVSVIAGSIGNAAKDTISAMKESTEERGRIAERKALCPIFADDLDSADFALTKLIRITDIDKKRAESEVCRDSIGYVSAQKDLRIVNIYRKSAEMFGLSFYPDMDREIYYVDPTDRNSYIALEEYFSYLKLVRVGELQKTAQDLGANTRRIVTRVLIPMSTPGIATGITMVFVPAVSTFIISRMLGGGSNLLIGDLIELQFLGNSYNYNLGSAMSLVLMVIVLLCMSFTSSFDEEDMEGVV